MSANEPRMAVALRGEDAPAIPTSPHDVTGLLQLALERNVPVETLERLVALHERVSDRAAAAEFAAALADFQNECPEIAKIAEAKIVTSAGGSFTYRYAPLDHIAKVVRPLLHARGFSYTWDSRMEEKLLSVTCILKHVNGHQQSATFASPVESKAGMSEQQKYAAALSYAKRLSLVQVLGITTADPDTDGANPEPITDEQVKELKKLAQDVAADEPKFLAYIGVERYEDIRRVDYNTAKQALESKRRARK